jgi:uncharacterized membrane protein
MTAVKSLVSGVFTFLSGSAVAYGFLLLFAYLFFTYKPGSWVDKEITRDFLAVAIVVVTLGAAFLCMVFVGRFLTEKFKADPTLTVGTVLLLVVLTGYWLLQILTVINSCTVGVSLPFTWVGDICNS